VALALPVSLKQTIARPSSIFFVIFAFFVVNDVFFLIGRYDQGRGLTQRRKGAKKNRHSAAFLCVFAPLRAKSDLVSKKALRNN